MGQKSTTLAPLAGVPGKIYDLSTIQNGDLVSFVAATAIPFGVVCELNASGQLQPVQDINANWPPSGALTGTSLAGISVWGPENVMMQYLGTAPPVPPTGAGTSTPGYAQGARVPVLRRGRVWAAYDGQGTPTRIGSVNVWHSSTGANPQGVITFTATSGTAGSEVSTAPSSFESFNPDGTQIVSGNDQFGNAVSAIVVSVNLPGYGS
jgi:hypothetical protein